MRKILSLFMLGHVVMLSIAQQAPKHLRFEHLTVADGLPENSVVCILQDHLGFIWMGTQNGLVRYDGAKMTVYQYSADIPYSFKGRPVGALIEDKDGDIWIASESLFRFQRSTQHFIEYPDKDSHLKNRFPLVAFIHQDKQGFIWAIRFNYNSGRSELNRFDPKTNAWAYFSSDPLNPHFIEGNLVKSYNEYGLVEGPDGKIWANTVSEGGNTLQWFDLKKDKFIRYYPHMSPGMAEDFKQIEGIGLGNNGQLFLSCFYAFKGWFILDTRNGQIRQFKHDKADTGSLMSDSALITPYLDKSGFVWVSTSKGLDRYDPATNTFAHYISKPGDPSTPGAGWLRYPCETPEGDIWFQGNTGMSFYHRKTNSFIRYESDEKQDFGLWGYIVSTFVDRTGMVWLGSYISGLNKETRIAQFPLIRNIPGEPNSLQDATVYSIYEAPSEPGIIWFGTKTGLDRYDKKAGTYTHYRHEGDKENSISKGGVSSITEDKKGRFWVGTHGGGLNLMDRKKGSFIHFMQDTLNPNSLIYNNITFLRAVSDGTLWIGTYYGLEHFEFDNNQFTYYQKADTSYTPELFNLIAQYTTPDRRVAAIVHPGDNQNITIPFDLGQSADVLICGMGEITSINNDDWGWIEDASGKVVWEMNIANTLSDGYQDARLRAGIIRLGPGSYRLRYKSDSHYSYGHWNGPAPYHFGLWGLQITRVNAKEIRVFNNEAVKRSMNGPGGNSINCITEDAKKKIWIGSSDLGGVSKFDPVTGKFNFYIDDVKGPLAITGSILEDKKTGNFWVGDYSFGLLLINENGDIIKRYNASNGLSGNSIEGILQDSTGILWVSTDNGLCRFDPVTEKFQLYSRKHGLQGLAFNEIANCSTADGEMYFGGANGVNAFYPNQIDLDTTAFPVVLTDLDIKGKPVTIGKDGQIPIHISLAKEIVLPYDQNDLTFHFTNLLFNRGNESQFAFRLSPSDKDWVQSGAIRQARYTSLSPGSYTFSVKAANADGFWNEQGVSIIIHISPPWWRTWWAYALYSLALLGGIFGFIAYRSAALKRENKILEGKVELRTSQLQTSIENLKSTQAQLIQSEKMASLGELTAGIAHEIQNPLNFVNNFSEVNMELMDELAREADKGDINEIKAISKNLKDNEQKINHHGKRADAIVKGMLQHSRANSGAKEPTDVNALADEYLRLAYHGLRAKDNSFNAAIKTEFDESIGKINIVPQDMGRVLLNLYNNAFFAANEMKKTSGRGFEPAVSVRTKKSENHVFISVMDNGTGISQKLINKIFQPFFTTKPAGQGTGLGLSLSYDIVQAHGGKLSVNAIEGEFTEFVVQLPISG